MTTVQSFDLGAWLRLIEAAIVVGGETVAAVKAHAATALTPGEYAQLEQAWRNDVEAAAANAGLDPATGEPLPDPKID